jgi:hypothetical protein
LCPANEGLGDATVCNGIGITVNPRATGSVVNV